MTNPPQVNKGEGMREMAEQIYDSVNGMPLTLISDKLAMIEALLLQVAAQARSTAIEECMTAYKIWHYEIDGTKSPFEETLKALAAPDKEDK